MTNKRYYVNRETKGRIIADVSMGRDKHEQFAVILTEQGYEAVSRDEYRRFTKSNPQS